MIEAMARSKQISEIAKWVAPSILASAICLSAHAQPAPPSTLIRPHALAYDSAGNYYVANTGQNVILKVTHDGTTTIVAGDGEQGYAGDGGPATSALLDSPAGVAVDSNNNIYIADTHNHVIREVLASTGNIFTIAGTGSAGFSGDGSAASAALLNYPTAVAVDSNGNVYIADTNNHRIREISGGNINTVAGNGDQGYEGDGVQATLTGLDSPNGVGVDSAFNIYIGDTHNQRVRMVTNTTGNIATLAGTGVKGFTGDGSAVSSGLARPRGVAVDIYGNVYVADSDNNLIRTISGGNISTIAGNGTEGSNGGGTASTSTTLDTPAAVAAFGTSILFSDTENSVIDDVKVQLPPVTLSATSLAFGGIFVGSWSASQWVSLVNNGSVPLSISSVSVTGVNADQFVMASTCVTTLAPQASCFIHGHFQPTATGPATAAVTIIDSDSSSPQSIALSGTGVAPTGAITLQLSSLNFSSTNVGSSSGAQSVTVTNTGAAVVNIGSIALTGANASEFVFANNCGASLAIGASCIVHGHFAPTTIGAASAAVTITDDAAGSPQSIALSGTGVASSATLSANTLAFGSVTVNTVAASQSVTLTNNGNSILTIASIAVTGANASDFVFANNCGASLAAGASCTIHGHFAPTTTSAETAAVTITDSDATSPQTIALSGTGVAATAPLTFSSPSLPAGSTPTNLNFGSIDMGATSASQSVIMTNTGTAVVNIGSIAVTGASSSQFVFANSCGATLGVGASCVIQGHFAPTGPGPMSAAVTVTDDAAGSPQTIALSGTGVTQQLTLSANSLWFGTITVGASSVSESVTLTNVGTGALAIASIAVTGNNPSSFVFANNCGTSLASGASCVVHGHFAPTTTGLLNAAITITSADPGSPQTILLSGNGQ